MKYYRVRTNGHIYWRNDDGIIRYCAISGFIEISDLNYGRKEHKLIPLTFKDILNINLDGASDRYKEYVVKVLKELIHEHQS